MAQIVVKQWRSSDSSWTKFVRTPTCWALVGKTLRGSSVRTWMGKKCRIGNVFLFIENRDFLIGFRGWYQNGWKEGEYGSHVEEMDDTRRSWRTDIISQPRVLGIYSTWMLAERNHYWWIQNSWKITRMGNISRKNGFEVLRRGRTRSNLRWEILRTGEQKERGSYTKS